MSSDSESHQDARPIKKSKTNKKELFASKDVNPKGKKENYDSNLDQDIESVKNQASKVKSPVKKLEKEDEKSFKEMNINDKGGK